MFNLLIMSGEDFKEILRKNGYKLADIAKMLGYTQQRLNSILNADDVKSSFVELVAKQLNKSVGFFYNCQQTTNGSNVNGDGNNVNHDSHDTYYSGGTDQMDGALCKFDKSQFTQIIELINELNKHCSVKDSQIEFCTEQITKLIKERDSLQKQLMEIYRTGTIDREK